MSDQAAGDDDASRTEVTREEPLSGWAIVRAVLDELSKVPCSSVIAVMVAVAAGAGITLWR